MEDYFKFLRLLLICRIVASVFLIGTSLNSIIIGDPLGILFLALGIYFMKSGIDDYKKL